MSRRLTTRLDRIERQATADPDAQPWDRERLLRFLRIAGEYGPPSVLACQTALRWIHGDVEDALEAVRAVRQFVAEWDVMEGREPYPWRNTPEDAARCGWGIEDGLRARYGLRIGPPPAETVPHPLSLIPGKEGAA